MKKTQIRKTEEVWMNKLGRLSVFHTTHPEIYWVIKKELRKLGFKRLGVL